MSFTERNNPEIIGFVKDRCAEFGQNNPELDPDYIDGYFQGAREAMLNVIYLIYTQMEQNKLRSSFDNIESWKL